MTEHKRQKLSDEQDLVISQRLRSLRESRGLTLKTIAENLGMDQRAYEKYEYGFTMPSARVVRKFAEFYDVTTDYIVGLVSVPLPIWRERAKRED